MRPQVLILITLCLIFCAPIISAQSEATESSFTLQTQQSSGLFSTRNIIIFASITTVLTFGSITLKIFQRRKASARAALNIEPPTSINSPSDIPLATQSQQQAGTPTTSSNEPVTQITKSTTETTTLSQLPATSNELTEIEKAEILEEKAEASLETWSKTNGR